MPGRQAGELAVWEHQRRNAFPFRDSDVIGGEEAHEGGGAFLEICVTHKPIFIRKMFFLNEDRQKAI